MNAARPAPEPTRRLVEALARLRAAALAAFARRLGLRLQRAAVTALEARYGLARSAELLRFLARLPRPARSLVLCCLLHGTRR